MLRRSPLRMRAAVARRCIRRYGFHPTRLLRAIDARMVFVVGSPRSGTSFTAEAIGGVDGFADLGEVNAVKALVPRVHSEPAADIAPRLRRILAGDQRAGLVAGLRAIEQTPESSYVMTALALAFPGGKFLHLVRDGRDVACSLIERGWLRDGSPGVAARATQTKHDDAGQPFGDYARFWVEPERREEFATVSEARRAGWAWRRYNEAALAHGAALGPDRVLQVRYERLATEPAAVAAEVAAFLDAADREQQFAEVLGRVHARSLGRWRNDLTSEQVADVEREAGPLLDQLGYERVTQPVR